MYKIRTHHNHPHGRVFAWMAMIVIFGMTLIYPIFPNFAKDILKSDQLVSVFYSVMALMMLVGALISTVVFKKMDRIKITKWGLLIGGIVLFSFIIVNRVWDLSLLYTLQTWIKLFLLIALSLFVRDFANINNLGYEEGYYYRYSNIGYFLGPFLGGFIAIYLGYESVFILAAAILFGGLAYFYNKHIIEKHPAIITQTQVSTHQLGLNVRDFFANDDRLKAFSMNLILHIWVAFKHLYIPLYVVTSGYLESMSGLILSLGILSLILLEVKVGNYADKQGIRLPVSSGFAIIALALLTVFISPWPILNFLVLILANLGVALIEPLKEYYLFKNLPREDENRLYGVYMTAEPLGYFLGPAFGALILSFFTFKFLFLFFALAMFVAAGAFWLKLRNQ